MDKNNTIDQLFAKARNQEPQYSFTEVAERFHKISSEKSEFNLPTKHSFFSFKFLLMLSSFIAVLITSLFLFQENTNPNRIQHERDKSRTAIVDSNSNSQNNTQNNASVKSKTTISNPTQFINYLVDSLSSMTENIPSSEQIEPKMGERQVAHKQDDPYIFPKLTEKEIKETQKLKKAMLRALEKMDKKSYAFIASGPVDFEGETITIQSFIIQKTEVSNLEYRTFLFDLLIQDRKEDFLKAKPDQLQWNKLPGGQNNKMVEHYFSHPAYDNYPVVNISREGAEMYCKWLTNELKTVVDEKKKSLYNPVRLPLRSEWVKSVKKKYFDWPYPWGVATRDVNGTILANYRLSKEEYDAVSSTAFMDVTAPVNSYYPSDLGLYNMCGNVAEMVYNDLNPKTHGTAGGGWMNTAEEIKILGPDPYSGVTSPHPGIGFRVVMTVNNQLH